MIYIYELVCPISGKPRYIGKTQNPETRLRAHLSKARTAQTKHHCAQWICQLLRDGLKPVLRIVFEVPESEAWQGHEIRIIEEYHKAGHELTNLTGGGGGFYKANPELLLRRGKTRSAQLADPETNKRFSEALKKGNTAEVCARKAKSVKAAWDDPIKRASYLAGMAAPDAVKRRSKATFRRMNDPDIAIAHKQKMRELYKDPIRLEQLRQAQLKRWAMYRERKARPVAL